MDCHYSEDFQLGPETNDRRLIAPRLARSGGEVATQCSRFAVAPSQGENGGNWYQDSGKMADGGDCGGHLSRQHFRREMDCHYSGDFQLGPETNDSALMLIAPRLARSGGEVATQCSRFAAAPIQGETVRCSNCAAFEKPTSHAKKTAGLAKNRQIIETVTD